MYSRYCYIWWMHRLVKPMLVLKEQPSLTREANIKKSVQPTFISAITGTGRGFNEGIREVVGNFSWWN